MANGIFGLFDKFRNTTVKAIGNYKEREDVGTGSVETNPPSTGRTIEFGATSEEIFKAFIPWFLYKPPYGFPREINVLQIRQLAKNPYIFSVIKTIQDEVAQVPFELNLKEEYIDEGYEEDPTKKREIMEFFRNPNGNNESFEHLLRCWVRDICELDAGIGVKVFDNSGKFRQLFARDGGTFLKNPDIHGYIGNRMEFVPAPTQYILTGGIPKNIRNQLQNAKNQQQIANVHEKIRSETYDAMYRDSAAYFQYGWTAGARPVPFGKRELMWVEVNPRTDSIYGRSPIEILYDQILTLVYGSEYNLDFYLNNNMPTGLLTIKGASPEQAKAYRAQMEKSFMNDDVFGNTKKKHFKVPITGYEASFQQLQMNSKEMQIIEQQKWFTKMVWSCFGVTADEMGFTEDSNRATGENQSDVAKRRAVKPFLSAIEYAINTQLMPEFECPQYEFKFKDYDLQEDLKKHELYKMQIESGIRTAKQIATEELGIGEDEFDKAQQEKNESQMQMQEQMNGVNGEDEDEEEGKDIDKYKESIQRIKENKVKATTSLGRDLVKQLKELEKRVIEEVTRRIENEGLANIKGYSNVKAMFDDLVARFGNYFDSDEYKVKIEQFIKEEFEKGVEEIEKKIDQNVVVSTQDLNEFSDYVVQNVKDMNTELAADLRKQINMGIFNREGIPAIKKRIKSVFDTSEARAQAIARTESTRALNMGHKAAAKESGIKFKKKWDAHEDDRTSEVCMALDGQVVDMDEKFEYKGEKYDLPPAHVNCRSRVLYIQED